MSISIFGSFEVNGTPEDLAKFMTILIYNLQTIQNEKDEAEIRKEIDDILNVLKGGNAET